MKKVLFSMLLILGFIAIAGTVLRGDAASRVVQQEKDLCYTRASDTPSPIELKQVTFVPVPVAGPSFHPKIAPVAVAYVSVRVTQKLAHSRYPLFIKERVHSPVFLLNSCLRI